MDPVYISIAMSMQFLMSCWRLQSLLVLLLFSFGTCLEVLESDQVAHYIPSYKFGPSSWTPTSIVCSISREQFLPNATILLHITAPMFPIQDYVDKCQSVGCLGIILYASADLQTVLEIAAWAETIQSTSIPVIALGKTDLDVSSIRLVRITENSEAHRFEEAIEIRLILLLMNAVLLHRLFNAFYSVHKLIDFMKAQSRATYPILVVIFYLVSSIIGIVAFESLSLHKSMLLSFRIMLLLLVLDALVLYCGRIAMGMNLARSRAKTMTSKTYSLDAIKNHVTVIGFLMAVVAVIILCSMKSLPKNCFTLLLFLITLPHIIFIVFNARNTGTLVNILLTNGRELTISEEQRRIRMSFSRKAFGATMAGIATMLMQILFIIFQSRGPFEFLLLYTVQSFGMSQIEIYTMAALKPVAKSPANPAKQTTKMDMGGRYTVSLNKNLAATGTGGTADVHVGTSST